MEGTAMRLLIFLFCATVIQAQEVFAPRELKAIPVRQSQIRQTPHNPPMQTLWKTYYGRQASNYPLNKYPKIAAGFDVPVMIGGFPDRRYTILGHVFVYYPPNQFPDMRRAAIRAAATDAKRHGADAFLLRPSIKLADEWYAAGTAIKWR